MNTDDYIYVVENKLDKDFCKHCIQKFNKDENNNLHHPSFLSITYNTSAKTKAINYVLWFNENQKQLDTYNRLLSTSKQARKRRRRRAHQTAKRINTTND